MVNEIWWLMLASRIAGIGLILSLTIFASTFLVWCAFTHLERQFKRLTKSLAIQDIHEFGKEYRQWKAERKEQENSGE